MIKVNTHEAKTKLSSLLAAVEQRGEIVILCRNGAPIAEIRPLPKRRNPLTPHPKLAKVVFRENPMTPLTERDWPGLAR